MLKLSPQKEYILSFLRKGGWVCGSAWLGRVKDDRRRIFELSDYMASKGYRIAGEACKGRACGNRRCPLFMRRAEKLQPNTISKPAPTQEDIKMAQKLCEDFDRDYARTHQDI